MTPTERDLQVALAVRDEMLTWIQPKYKRSVAADIDLTAVIAALPEPEPLPAPTGPVDAETERFARIGRMFVELWEAGAPWPVRHWTCDKHKVKGCWRCKASTSFALAEPSSKEG